MRRKLNSSAVHNKCKAAWLLRRAVKAHYDTFYWPTSAEQRMKLGVDCHKCEIADINGPTGIGSSCLGLFASVPVKRQGTWNHAISEYVLFKHPLHTSSKTLWQHHKATRGISELAPLFSDLPH